MSGVQRIPGNMLAGAHCAGRDAREQLMNRCEQYIIDPVAALPFAPSDLPPRGHDS